MAHSGGQPTAALAITCISFPVRRGFIMTLRSCCVSNLKNRRAFIIFASRSFSRLLALHFHALKWQLATSPALSAPSYHIPFHNSIFADPSTLFFRRPSLSSHLVLFFSSTRSSFPCLRVAVSYKPGRICAQLPLSAPQFHLRHPSHAKNKARAETKRVVCSA
jgi:hypothetical protein